MNTDIIKIKTETNQGLGKPKQNKAQCCFLDKIRKMMKLVTGLIRNELGLTRTKRPMVKADVAAGSTDRESKIYNNELYNNKVNKPEELVNSQIYMAYKE